MATDPTIGVVARTVDDEPRPAIGADMDTIIIVGPAPGANPRKFKLNEPVKGYSNDSAFLKALNGPNLITDAIDGINAQLAAGQLSAQLIVLRTPDHATEANAADKLRLTIRDIIGSSVDATGLWAGLLSAEKARAIPRIWLIPGYTGVLANSLGSIEVVVEGEGYVPGQSYPLVFTGGGPNAVMPRGTVTADANGVLMDPVLESYGAYIDNANSDFTCTVEAPPASAGAKTGTFTVTADMAANPVCANMGAVLSQYYAHGIVESAGTSQANDELWRQAIDNQRLIGLSGGVKVIDPTTGTVVVRPLAPRMAGVMLRRDYETGGPFFSACNQAIQGIVGPARQIRYNISNGDNEGQSLLRNNIGIVVEGELGNDFAISEGGYILLSTDNLGSDNLWRFYNQTRGRDFINLTAIRTLRYYLGRSNLTAHTIQCVVTTMEDILQKCKSGDQVIGYKVGFKGSQNSASEIRLGNLTIYFAAEEPAPLRKITVIGSRYRPAIDAMVSQLEASLNIAA